MASERDPDHPSATPLADEVEAALREMAAGHRTWLGPVEPELREPAVDPAAIAWGQLRDSWEELKRAVRDAYRRGREGG